VRDGDVLLAALPQEMASSGSACPPFEKNAAVPGFLVCSISTQIQQAVPDLAETLHAPVEGSKNSGFRIYIDS
jgi:hypothetical protein